MSNISTTVRWVIMPDVVDFAKCDDVSCILLWVRTVVDKHYCGGLLCLLWWVMLGVVLFIAYCYG